MTTTQTTAGIEIMALCSCCEEREAHPLCGGECAECRKPTMCEGGWLCDSCRRRNEKHDWLDATCKAVESLAVAHEWEAGRWHHAETGSRYVELTRECDSCILGDDDCTCETIKVRVSDHGSAYCSEDYSIAMNPSGDDHSLEILAARLARRAE